MWACRVCSGRAAGDRRARAGVAVPLVLTSTPSFPFTACSTYHLYAPDNYRVRCASRAVRQLPAAPGGARPPAPRRHPDPLALTLLPLPARRPASLLSTPPRSTLYCADAFEGKPRDWVLAYPWVAYCAPYLGGMSVRGARPPARNLASRHRFVQS